MLLNKKERVVVVPLSGESFWIEDTRVSSGYLEKMGVFLSDLLLNRSPADVEWKNRAILEYVHPKFYHEIKKTLSTDQAEILKHNQSFVFQSERSYAQTDKMTFIIEGEALVLVSKNGNTTACAQQERRIYHLGFQCQNGKLLLVSLKKEEGYRAS